MKYLKQISYYTVAFVFAAVVTYILPEAPERNETFVTSIGALISICMFLVACVYVIMELIDEFSN